MKRVGAVALAAAVLGLVAVGIPSAAAAPAAPVPVEVAGADLVSVALDGSDRLSLGLRTADQRVHEPAAVLLPATGGSTGTVPDHPAYGFLGEPGRPVWALVPAGAAFPAWDTTGVPAAEVAGESGRAGSGGGTVTLELVEVDGPGGFHAYTISPVGEPRLTFGTSDRAPQRAALPAGARRGGAVWVFDTPGSHRVTLAATVKLASGATVTDRATYQVEVPALPPVLADLGLTGAFGDRITPVSPRSAQDPSPTDDETGEGRVVIADGHIDIGPRFVGGDWTIQVKDDTVSPHVWRNLHDVVLHVVDEAIIEVPTGDFDFLGQPGDEVWLLPQAQQTGILWPGWNTEHESVVTGIGGDTTWTLRGVDGPGEFVLFLTGSFGAAEILWNSQQGLPQDMTIPLRTHAHGNWAFTQPGVYHLTLEISATTSGGEQVSDTRVLAFAVGDETDPDTAYPPAGGGNGNGDGDGDGNGGAPLGKTGLSLIPLILLGLVLLLGGALLVVLTVRRRAAKATAAGTGVEAS